MPPSMLRPRAPRAPDGGQQPPGRMSIFDLAIGNRRPRYSRFLDVLKTGGVILKVPANVGVDEYNEVLGVGRTAIGAGATVPISVTAPRDVILRRLQLGDASAPTNFDWLVIAISIEGNAAVLGNPAGGIMFGPNNFNPITFDLPVTGGTSVTISVQNTGAAAIAMAGGWIID